MSGSRVSKAPQPPQQSRPPRAPPTSNAPPKMSPAEAKPSTDIVPRRKRMAFSRMIFDALFDLNRRIGMSVWSIAKNIAAKYNVKNKTVRPHVMRCVKSALREGLLEHATPGAVKLSQKGKEAARALHVKNSPSKTQQERNIVQRKPPQRAEHRPEQQQQQPQKRPVSQQQSQQQRNRHTQQYERPPQKQQPPTTEQQRIKLAQMTQQQKLMKNQQRLANPKPPTPIKNRSRTNVHSPPVPTKTRSNSSLRRTQQSPTTSRSSVRSPHALSKTHSNTSVRRNRERPRSSSKTHSNSIDRRSSSPQVYAKNASKNSARGSPAAPVKARSNTSCRRAHTPPKSRSNTSARRQLAPPKRGCSRGSHPLAKNAPLKTKRRNARKMRAAAKHRARGRNTSSSNNNCMRKTDTPLKIPISPVARPRPSVAQKRAKARKRKWDDVVEILNQPRESKVKAKKALAKLKYDD